MLTSGLVRVLFEKAQNDYIAQLVQLKVGATMKSVVVGGSRVVVSMSVSVSPRASNCRVVPAMRERCNGRFKWPRERIDFGLAYAVWMIRFSRYPLCAW